MSIKIVFILLALSGVAGIILGYVLRWLIGLAQRGSLELDIKQKMLSAKEQAAKILSSAEFRAKVLETERLDPIEEREEKLTAREERLATKSEFLDERQRDLDTKEDEVRSREQETAHVKKEAEALIAERTKVLAKAAGLSEEAAREELMREIERAYE